ncbi:MAG: BatA domain-containing protein [Planctomycetes bacterium]|nr:BatA domain-containing protein [Planctomycetota bacterium]
MPSFLNPLLAWFALAGSIPVIIHILNRQKYRQVRWGAMEFLLAALKKTRRRLQFENLILLLIRVAICVLLAFALAQPVLESAPLGLLVQNDTHAILAIDNSYSMAYQIGRKTPFERAREAALSVVNGLKVRDGDHVSLFLIGETSEALIGDPSIQVDRAKSVLKDLTPSDRSSSFPRCVDALLECAKRSPNTRKKVYVFTDFQRLAFEAGETAQGRFRDALRDLSKAADLILVDVGEERPSNATITKLTSTTKVVGTEKTTTFYVEVLASGEGSSGGAGLTFNVDGNRQESQTVSLSPGQPIVVPFVTTFHEPGPHFVGAELDGDPLPPDNRRFLALDVRDTLRVLLVDGEPDAELFKDEVVFLRYALRPTDDPLDRISLFQIDTATDITFPEMDLRRYDLLVLANLTALTSEKAADLESYVRAGGGLLVYLGDRVEPATYNELLWRDGNGVLPARLGGLLGDEKREREVKLGDLDDRRPPFEYFRSLQDKLQKLLFFRYYALEMPEERPDVRVLARFADEARSPAFVEKTLQRGKCILCTTSADDEWNLLPGKQPYLILVDQMATYLSAQAQGFTNVTVGEPIEHIVKVEQYSKHYNIGTPRQGLASVSPIPLDTPAGAGGEAAPAGTDSARLFLVAFPRTDDAGVYTLERPSDEAVPRSDLLSYFAVNVNPEEGNLSRITEEELKQRFAETKFEYRRSLEGGGRPVEQKPPSSHLWKYLAYAW